MKETDQHRPPPPPPLLRLDIPKLISQGNPIEQIQFRFKEIENVWESIWNPSSPVPATTLIAATTLGGAALGAVSGILNLIALPPEVYSGGPLLEARNIAATGAVSSSIFCVMRRLKGGKEDIQSGMVAAFGSGATLSLVSGAGGPSQAANAVGLGLLFALTYGGICKLAQKSYEEDVPYAKAKQMLKDLSLEKYEKNFKKGHFMDSALPMLTDRALKDVSIPPGARLLILDQIHRDPELKGSREK